MPGLGFGPSKNSIDFHPAENRSTKTNYFESSIIQAFPSRHNGISQWNVVSNIVVGSDAKRPGNQAPSRPSSCLENQVRGGMYLTGTIG